MSSKNDQSYQQTYKKLCDAVQEATMVERIQHLLEWDEQTKMPKAGGAYRAEQMAYMAGLVHQKQTAPEMGEWLDQLADSPLADDTKSDTGSNLYHLRRDYDKKTKLPQSLVEQLAKACTLGQQVWVEARRADNFKMFQPNLEEIIRLKREEASALGYEETPYDPLLDDYEPGESTENVARVLSELRAAGAGDC